MKKKTTRKTITLAKETLRALQEHELAQIAGGATVAPGDLTLANGRPDVYAGILN